MDGLGWVSCTERRVVLLFDDSPLPGIQGAIQNEAHSMQSQSPFVRKDRVGDDGVDDGIEHHHITGKGVLAS